MPAATGARPRAPRLREADIQTACVDFLALDGWRPLRTDPCSDRGRGKGFGEEGMADHLFLRASYIPHHLRWERLIKRGEAFPKASVFTANAAAGEILWVEFKRPRTGRVAEHQHDWHLAERLRAFLTVVASIDFEPTYDGFVTWYRNSGLLRREGL